MLTVHIHLLGPNDVIGSKGLVLPKQSIHENKMLHPFPPTLFKLYIFGLLMLHAHDTLTTESRNTFNYKYGTLIGLGVITRTTIEKINR